MLTGSFSWWSFSPSSLHPLPGDLAFITASERVKTSNTSENGEKQTAQGASDPPEVKHELHEDGLTSLSRLIQPSPPVWTLPWPLRRRNALGGESLNQRWSGERKKHPANSMACFPFFSCTCLGAERCLLTPLSNVCWFRGYPQGATSAAWGVTHSVTLRGLIFPFSEPLTPALPLDVSSLDSLFLSPFTSAGIFPPWGVPNP